MTLVVEEKTPPPFQRLPAWLRQEIPDAQKVLPMKRLLRQAGLATVCESALCPNLGRCWGAGVATLMILGDICTRSCRFCAVKAGVPAPADSQEPEHTAFVVEKLNLRYVVVTSVARDDLPDEGSGQFAQTIAAVRRRMPQTKIDVLIPDFSNKKEHLQEIVRASPDVISHNLETVRRLSPGIRPQADYDRSLAVLKNFKEMAPSILTKSSLMLGLGETPQETREAMKDLAAAGCDMLTLGQYLAPTKRKRHVPVARFLPPEEFWEYRRIGLEMGFKHVMSAPWVRSSYIAEEGYRECLRTLSLVAKGHQG